MKKTLITAIIGYVIVITFAVFIQGYLERSSKDLVNQIENLIIIVDRDAVNESMKFREELQEEWDNTKYKWAALIDHEEIDNIEETMHRVEMLVGDPEEKVELLSELNKLGFYLEHIPEREDFLLENIL